MTSPRRGRQNGQGLLRVVLKSLDNDKAEDVVTINLKGKTSIADDMIVATGRSSRHVSALAQNVVEKLAEAGYGKARVEGLAHGDWVLIDAGDVIVHIFRPDVRAFYKLEKLWGTHLEAEPVAARG